MNSVSSQKGFVLVTTIWMIAILMLLGSMFHAYVNNQLQAATLLQGQLQRSIDMLSTEETALYLMMISRTTRAGLAVFREEDAALVDDFDDLGLDPTGSELRVDGTAYRGQGCARFAIQERAGLLALNSTTREGWAYEDFRRVSTATQAQLLAASLEDYIDEDNLRNVGGAERGDYLNIGAAPPANSKLRSDAEIFSVYGWANWLNLDANREWQNWVDIGEYYVLNVNSAPAGLLGVAMDLRREEVERLIRARVEKPFSSLDEVAEEVGRLNVWMEDKFTFSPLLAMRLEVWCEGSSLRTVRGLKMTPMALDGPQETDYYYRRSYGESKKDTGSVLEISGNLFTSALPANQG